MIYITINNQKTKFEGDQEVLNKLFKHLSFRHPNAYHIQQRMKRHWDGLVKPMTDAGYIQTGLLDTCINYLVNQGIHEFQLKDFRELPIWSDELVTEFRGISLRDYQVEALQSVKSNSPSGLVPNPRGILQMSMNAGKSIIAMALHENIVQAKTLILLNSSLLYQQMKADLIKIYPNNHGYMQGKSIKWGDIMVCMLPTLSKRLVEYSNQLKTFNVLIVDECDLAANKTSESVYKHLWHITFRIGLTGTAFIRDLRKDQIRNLEMRKIFGEALYEVTMKDLEDNGTSAVVHVMIYQGNDKQPKSAGYLDEYRKGITLNDKRDRKIVRLLKKQKRDGYFPVLLVNKYVEQCERVYETVRSQLPWARVGIIHTNTPSKDKTAVVKAFRDGDIDILVANLLIKRGMNLPLIRCVINNAGGEHPSTPAQVMGRGSRAPDLHKDFRFIDFIEKGKHIGAHSRRRVAFYKKQGIKVTELYKLK